MRQLPQDLADQLTTLRPTAEGKLSRETTAITSQEQQLAQLTAARDVNAADRTNAQRALVVEADLQILRTIYENMQDGDPREPALLDMMRRWAGDAAALAAASDQ